MGLRAGTGRPAPGRRGRNSRGAVLRVGICRRVGRSGGRNTTAEEHVIDVQGIVQVLARRTIGVDGADVDGSRRRAEIDRLVLAIIRRLDHGQQVVPGTGRVGRPREVDAGVGIPGIVIVGVHIEDMVAPGHVEGPDVFQPVAARGQLAAGVLLRDRLVDAILGVGVDIGAGDGAVDRGIVGAGDIFADLRLGRGRRLVGVARLVATVVASRSDIVVGGAVGDRLVGVAGVEQQGRGHG